MRKRRNNRRAAPRSMKLKWGVFIAIIFAFAGVSYAAHTNVLYNDFGFVTGDMSFIFDDDTDVAVEMTKGSDGESVDLGGKASYKDKKLFISDIGPIDMDSFKDGNVNITIQYAIKAEDDKTGIVRPAEVKKDDKTGYDLGLVEFKRQFDTPVWSLENGDVTLGTKTDGIGRTPNVIDQLLPEILGEFHVYNQILPHEEDGVMSGTLLLKQEGDFAVPDINEIKLSDLSLSKDVISVIQNDSLLEIQGTYGFTIPINLDQFNVDKNENR